MDGAAILPAIELFIALLAVTGLVAIAARPLHLPQTVALVIVGLVIGALASAFGLAGQVEVPPELVLLVLLPGLVFEAAYRLRLAELRRWSVVGGAWPSTRPGLPQPADRITSRRGSGGC